MLLFIGTCMYLNSLTVSANNFSHLYFLVCGDILSCLFLPIVCVYILISFFLVPHFLPTVVWIISQTTSQFYYSSASHLLIDYMFVANFCHHPSRSICLHMFYLCFLSLFILVFCHTSSVSLHTIFIICSPTQWRTYCFPRLFFLSFL